MREMLLAAALAGATWAQPAQVREMADRWADTYGIERELVHAVIEVESGGQARAVSPAGAAGVMQLMPATAAEFRVGNRFDPDENIRGGVAYLAWLRDRCDGDLRLMLASYNAGHARVLKRGLRFSSNEVLAYVERVTFVYRRNRWESVLRARRSFR
jgi:soluble lytic murein transglycosylase-like protein